jgi:hypothetical protein
VRRLHVPQYEEARQYWSRGLEEGYFEGANESWPYTQAALRGLVEKYGDAGNS